MISFNNNQGSPGLPEFSPPTPKKETDGSFGANVSRLFILVASKCNYPFIPFLSFL